MISAGGYEYARDIIYRAKLNPDHQENSLGDRNLILGDTNNDGIADSSKVFFRMTAIIGTRPIRKSVNFGPDLSEIGAKLANNAIYKAIINQDAGISLGFEGE